MKKLWLCSLIFLGLGLWICSGRTVQAETADGTISPYALTVESLTDPVGIDAVAPRFAWKSRSVSPSAYNLSQSAYQILVASNPELLAEDNGDLWDSGKVKSFESLQIKYQGKTLKSSQRCYWKVRVWDQNDTVSEWSEPGFWIMGVVDPADWKAQWIAQPESLRPEVDLEKASWIANSEKPADGNPPQYFRREFVIDQPQQMFEDQNLAGTLYFAGNQRFEIFVNGNKAGYSIGMVFNPDQLRSIDISEYLVAGRNTVAFVASPGDSKDPVAIIAKLTVQTLDKSNAPANLPQPNRFGKPADTILTLVSDDSWFVSVKGGDRWNQNDPDYLEKNKDNWNAAVALFGPDEGPWGKLRRRTEQVSPMFQRSFSVEKPVQSAILHITGAGLYEASLDGSKIGDKLLTPSFTRYDRRMLYSTYDLTDRFRNAENSAHELEVMVGHSWYDVRSIVTWNFDAAPWRDFPRMIAQLELTYEDGTSEIILSDSSWTCSNSPMLFDCVRQGEIQQGNFNREILGQAVVVDAPKGKLSAEAFPATRITREFQVKSIRETAPGTCLVDLGANIAGWCRVCLPNAKPGDVIRFRYSERILEDGSIERHDIAMHFMEGTPAWMTGMKGEFQTDFYFCKGDGTDVFEPKFTYNGFQYLEIVGLREVPAVKDITACVLNTDFAPRASFECSNELYNKIQAATLSSYCANFVAGYPTDCPHREKNGWTGDAHLAAEQAMYNWENTASYEKWVQDLCDEQNEEGNLPGIVPTGGWGYPWGNGPAWDCSLFMIPWYLYVYRNDVTVLENSYEAMKKYIAYMGTRATDNLVSHGLGDWVFPKTETPTAVTSTGYYYVDTMILARAAAILGKTEDARKYSQLAQAIRESYLKVFVDENGVCSIGSQCSQATVLHQGFMKERSQAERQQALDHLVDAIRKADNHIDAGILGLKYMLRTLSEYGRTDQAILLTLQETRPSYAYWIRNGAGTLWEDWNEGSSRNHIMFGDISAWFFQSLAGIKLPAAGMAVADYSELSAKAGQPEDALLSAEFNAFHKFVIAPNCRIEDIAVAGFDPIKYVDARYDSPYGIIISSWKWNKGMDQLTLNVTVPVNTTAEIVLPFAGEVKSVAGEPEELGVKDGKHSFNVGSGQYSFVVKPAR